MRGDDCLQHEMHHQFAEGRLIEPADVNRAHRATVLGQGFRSCAPLGSDQITDALAGEAGLARKLSKIAIHRWTAPCAISCDDGDELISRTADEELQLAVLIDRPERSKRRRPLAVLAKTFSP